LLVVDSATVAGTLSQSDWIQNAEHSLLGVCNGGVVQDVRQILPLPGEAERGRVLSMMFGAVRKPAFFGAKVISVFPDNFARGLDSHRGAVLLFDAETGALASLLDGSEITAARTAAASAVATRILSRPESRVLAILGYGEQAARHFAAIAAVRQIEEVRCWGRDPDKAVSFARDLAARHRVLAIASPTVEAALAGADIVCTTTSARTPILHGHLLEAGMHVNVVGSSTADCREIDTTAVRRSSIWVDYRPMTEVSAGEYLQALAEGAIDKSHLIGEIGATLMGTLRGRRDTDEITMFKSLGMPAEDLYPAQQIYNLAVERGLGTWVDL